MKTISEKSWQEFRETGLFWFVNSILHVFGWVLVVDVDNEDELYTKLTEDSNTIPCIICGKEIPIDEIKTINDDPYCKKCRNNL